MRIRLNKKGKAGREHNQHSRELGEGEAGGLASKKVGEWGLHRRPCLTEEGWM